MNLIWKHTTYLNIFRNKNNMQKFTAEVELTPTMPSRMSENNSLDRKIHYLQSKKIWGKLEHDILCQFSGLVNGTRLAPFFCLILMKKGQNYKEQVLTLSCIRVDSSQIKTKTQQNHFGAKFVKLLFLYIFSVFSSYPPKWVPPYPPTYPKNVARA